MKNTPSHLAVVPRKLSLQGEVSSGIAAVALHAQADGPWVLLTVHKPGLQGHVLAHGQRVVHAETRSAEIDVAADGRWRPLWKGREALLALALLAEGGVEVELRAVPDPGPRHLPNVDAALSMVLLDMAVALDSGMTIGALPCVLEPANKAT